MKKYKIRILGLDDDADMHFIIKEGLKLGGLDNDCEFYTNTADFFRDFDDSVHLAIIDHYLDGMRLGFEVVREIQERVQSSTERLAGCEIIIISGQRNYEVLKKYHRLGVFDYIDKDEEDFEQRLVASSKKSLELSEHWIKYLAKWSDETIKGM